MTTTGYEGLLLAVSTAPNYIFVHPSTYTRVRRQFATAAVRDALGGRQRGGQRLRSRLPFRDRRAAAWAQVVDLWQREAAG